MKNLLLFFSVALLVVGCSLTGGTTVLEDTNNSEANTFVFDGENFTLTLPADYLLDIGAADGFIRPKEEGDFPAIKFGTRSGCKDNPTVDDMLENERAFLKIFCEETEGCGRLMEWESVEVGGKTGLKLLVQSNGRELGVSEGFINGYSYVVPILEREYDPVRTEERGEDAFYYRTCLFGFSISANDLEDFDNQAKIFDDIMQTITYK